MDIQQSFTDGRPDHTLMHVDFALDGAWTAVGGVNIPSVRELTVDGLMNQVLSGSSANLVLIGYTGNDTLHGSFTDDTLRGRGGGDNLFGGDGIDTADYDDLPLAVTVNLATGAGSGGDAAGDHRWPGRGRSHGGRGR